MQRRNVSSQHASRQRPDGRHSDGWPLNSRRSEPILLYGFGLALTLSLAFNGFLLREQSRHQALLYEYGPAQSERPDAVAVGQPLSRYAPHHERNDSLSYRPEYRLQVPPGQPSPGNPGQSRPHSPLK